MLNLKLSTKANRREVSEETKKAISANRVFPDLNYSVTKNGGAFVVSQKFVDANNLTSNELNFSLGEDGKVYVVVVTKESGFGVSLTASNKSKTGKKSKRFGNNILEEYLYTAGLITDTPISQKPVGDGTIYEWAIGTKAKFDLAVVEGEFPEGYVAVYTVEVSTKEDAAESEDEKDEAEQEIDQTEPTTTTDGVAESGTEEYE